ncbi:MAG TPA: hypothetical protein VN903_02655 [Polyangia bacterium]|jgi:hypothetical protein|nr:hypothetical protein [Polyangia bacterium]
MRALTALFVCALAVGSTAGCGDIDASTAEFPGTILYQDPGGAFELRLLQPPWLPPFLVKYSDFQMTFSVVPPPDATVTTDLNVILGQALFSLQMSKVTGDPAAAIAEVKGSLPGGSSVEPQGPISNASGSSGVEMAWQEEVDVFHRDAFLAGPGTPTFRLHFTAQQEITDDPMIGQMIASFRAK